jgi:hypothetical protein
VYWLASILMSGEVVTGIGCGLGLVRYFHIPGPENVGRKESIGHNGAPSGASLIDGV